MIVGAVGLHREDRAGLRAAAVDEDGAGAALAGVAADVRAGQAQLLAQEVDEQHAGLDVRPCATLPLTVIEMWAMCVRSRREAPSLSQKSRDNR